MEHFEGLTAEARIQRIALALFAERGYRETTIRAIADDAGVSPGLVLHHFGSKAGLREAVNHEVVRVMSGISAEIHQDMDDTLDEQYDTAAATFRALFSDRPELGAYIRRLFFDADEAGLQILEQFMQMAREFTEAFEARGWMRPAADPEMRDLQLVMIDMGPMLFQPILAAYFRSSPFDSEVYPRWMAAQYDLFSQGVFTGDGPAGTPGTESET